jgi:hypothetical protein
MSATVGSCPERPVITSSLDGHPALRIRLRGAVYPCYCEVWRVLYPILYGGERGESMAVTNKDGVQSLACATVLITHG